MKLTVIHSGLFKLDGGAMFGVVPKSMWTKVNPADENNLCTWSMRCLLVETGNRKILIDTGLGNKQDERFRSHFHPHVMQSLNSSLKDAGFTPDEITDVFLTHFHFDHVGGAIMHDGNNKLVPSFPNAKYWSNKEHYDWAFSPNPRERASFLKENFVPLKEEGIIHFLDDARDEEWIKGIKLRFVYGHTTAMMLPMIKMDNGKTLVFCADLMPSAGHVPLPWIMAYDVKPLETLKEKARMLKEAVEEGYILFFEHDAVNECATVIVNDRGSYGIGELMTLDAINL